MLVKWMIDLPLTISHNDARSPALPEYLHEMLPPMLIPSDRHTGKPLAQGTSFDLPPGRSLDVVVGLRESGQAGRVVEIRATGIEELNLGPETCLESGC